MTALGAMAPINGYGLCRQPVTVYHEDGGAVTRTVFPQAYLEYERAGETGRTGSTGTSGFLLVVPGCEPACQVGDKVMAGEGPEVPDEGQAAWWRALIPSKVPGLAVVRRVAPRYWNGEMVHTEAGG